MDHKEREDEDQRYWGEVEKLIRDSGKQIDPQVYAMLEARKQQGRFRSNEGKPNDEGKGPVMEILTGTWEEGDGLVKKFFKTCMTLLATASGAIIGLAVCVLVVWGLWTIVGSLGSPDPCEDIRRGERVPAKQLADCLIQQEKRSR